MHRLDRFFIEVVGDAGQQRELHRRENSRKLLAHLQARPLERALLRRRTALSPRTRRSDREAIEPDRLAASHKLLKLQTVGAEGTLTDGTRVIKLYTMPGFDHTDDMLLVYLPREKVLAEADAYTPGETPTTPLMAPREAYAATLVENIRRLHLDIRVIAPFHGMRLVDTAEVVWHAARAPRP